jgi:hypothetical protein
MHLGKNATIIWHGKGMANLLEALKADRHGGGAAESRGEARMLSLRDAKDLHNAAELMLLYSGDGGMAPHVMRRVAERVHAGAMFEPATSDWIASTALRVMEGAGTERDKMIVAAYVLGAMTLYIAQIE